MSTFGLQHNSLDFTKLTKFYILREPFGQTLYLKISSNLTLKINSTELILAKEIGDLIENILTFFKLNLIARYFKSINYILYDIMNLIK